MSTAANVLGARAAEGGTDLAESLVAAFFGRRGSQLRIDAVPAGELAQAYGTPAYVYSATILRRNYRQLQAAVSGFADVYYSIKANPNPAVVRTFVDEGAGLEIASGSEYLVARAAGCDPQRIVFAGPGKSVQELELAISRGIGEIHLESQEEIAQVAAIAERLKVTVQVAVRVNPLAAALGGAMRMGGRPAAFGFDEEILVEVVESIRRRPSLDLSGVHLFAGTQILDAKVLLNQWTHALRVAARVARLTGRPLRTLDLGGGLGIPYHAGDRPLDLEAVRAGLPALKDLLHGDPFIQDAHLILEPGRYLAGSAGIYLMSVRSVKMSRGTRFVVADGGMHHHLAASGNLGQVVKRDYPIVAAAAMDAGPRTAATLVGPLCTPLDTLGRQTTLPDLAPGGLIAVLQSGAYGLSASPVGFLGHPMPAEVMVDGVSHRLVRRPGTFDAPQGQVLQEPTET